MIHRVSSATRAVRRYSTDQGEDAFLSLLMKRIDSLSDAKKEKKTPTFRAQNAKPHKTQKAQKAQKAPAVSTKIVVKDHPLSNNSFKMGEERRAFAEDRGPRRQTQRPQSFERSERAPKSSPRSKAQSAPREQSGPRERSAPRERGGPRRDQRSAGGARGARTSRNSKADIAKPQSIVPKKLVEGPYKPSVSGDVFFHGKIAQVGLNTGSRVASVAKQTLLESKYPYKLPKSIIDSIDENFAGNDFLLQKDYSLDVDQQALGDRIRKVVKGETDDISVAEGADAAVQQTHRELMRSGDLLTSHKQMIYNITTGVADAKDLFKEAAWNKST